jgi:hypothetical protein
VSRTREEEPFRGKVPLPREVPPSLARGPQGAFPSKELSAIPLRRAVFAARFFCPRP